MIFDFSDGLRLQPADYKNEYFYVTSVEKIAIKFSLKSANTVSREAFIEKIYPSFLGRGLCIRVFRMPNRC